MDREKVIESLQYMISEDCTETQFDYIDDIEAAIVLLKEQEPKLVIRGRYNFPYCPHCSTEESRTELDNMLYPEMKFCPYCGKGILWDEG